MLLVLTKINQVTDMEIDDVVRKVILALERDGYYVKGGSSIPVGVSNRHIHLSKQHIGELFGENYALTKMKDLSQPNQYACQECVTLVGPKGTIENIRILGPERANTQVEILASDCFKVGIEAAVRESGNIKDTSGAAIVGPKGCIQLKEGVIVAARHIHMNVQDAKRFGCMDGDYVKVEFGGIRGGRFDNVLVRVSDMYRLDFHINIDEANCFGIRNKDLVKIIR